MYAQLLVEVGVEELPAIPLLKIIDNIKSSWSNILDKYMLTSDFDFFYTPRRLVLIHDAIPLKQASSVVELFGPPVAIAVKDGVPTPAGVSFANKCGVDFDSLSTKEDRGKEVLYYSSTKEGVDTATLLEEMLKEWISSMAFGKMMRWADRSDEFIRPIRWLQVRLDDSVVDAELFGVKSNNFTYVHRMNSFEKQEVVKNSDFETILKNGNVLLDPKNRRELILQEFAELEKDNNITIEIDEDLLDEVVAITENPKALLGSFDESFLELPPEVIITSMKENQRYFPVFNNDKLSNHFVVVSNALTDDYSKVIAGNERVLKPRLSDAMFFYKNDLKRGLKTDGLELVQFMDGLGSVADKIDREEKIALYLANKFGVKGEKISQAIRLAKADLTSEMVYEFTELQGLMGHYYAKALNLDSDVCLAIKEQYMPVGEGSELPSTIFSAIVAMAIKLDTLIGLFSVGKIPTGSKDPFALRRAVNGIVRIVLEFDLPFDIDEMTKGLSGGYKEFDLKQLKAFMLERISKSIDMNPSIINAVLASGESDIVKIFKKCEALNSIVSGSDFKDISITFKRVANISKDVSNFDVDEDKFELDEEKNLYKKFKEITSKNYESYEDNLKALFSLKELLDNYFDKVMVNSDDVSLKNNRLATIGQIYNSFKEIADIKEITI
ncbi:Glycyl-tRNA synthetase beta subunit [Sulfurovum sp. enrichment culture clone C5]|uniref:Glycine--tRNA ligase beta subunit n=1 Tax=Sulfurovum sp. enrichment culture clone C5 TaxID=497650 RepID=A0A0S4XQM1_9BACT|nr:Glycyl-tRNA synthetase beta subunit [Sulfurovum sp. enrichment culture clone C5]